MTLSVAEIDRWDAGEVREVFHATRSRAEAAMEAADGISTLPAFQTWGGDGAEAARRANGRIRADLDAHGREALAVARAADRAADGVAAVKDELAALRGEAQRLGLTIDASTSTVSPGPQAATNPVSLLQAAQLQGRLTALLTEAQLVDEELAHAIGMAGGAEPIPDAGAPVGADGLTPTQVASDANQQRMEADRADAQSRVDDLQRRFDELSRKAYEGDRSSATWDELHDVGARLGHARDHLGDLDAVHDALGKAPETYLTVYDPRNGSGRPVLAAVAVGNPDTARNVSVTVPGLGSTTKDSLPGMVSEARNLQIETQRQMHNAGIPGSAATIAWMGYEPPANVLNTGSPADALATLSDGDARTGAASLSSYLRDIRAHNPGGHLTLLGHSYGSLTSSLALQDLDSHGVHPVDDVIFYGSPGLDLTSADQLGLGTGHAYAMDAPGDPVTNYFAPLAGAHGWGTNPYDGMFPELSSQAGTDPSGIVRDGVQGHADYARSGANQQLRMSGYNMAAILAGLPTNAVPAP